MRSSCINVAGDVGTLESNIPHPLTPSLKPPTAGCLQHTDPLLLVNLEVFGDHRLRQTQQVKDRYETKMSTVK